MVDSERTQRPARAEDGARRRFVLLAGVVAVLALLHFVDHVIRGELVAAGGLNPLWNHSGWPFDTRSDAPFVLPVSFVVVFGLLVGGVVFTLRGRLWAGYWLGTSIFLTALLAFVHFVGAGSGTAETPGVIAMSHGHAVPAALALIDLFAMFVVLAVLAFHAVRTRQRFGRW